VVPIGMNVQARSTLWNWGVGTVHHGLVGGTTGSGKTNLIHVLLTGLAEAYGPEELELYLADFKEGVEFKDYQTADLPHARIVALESEPELGLSILAPITG